MSQHSTQLCQICQQKNGKYKCPQCSIGYCSSACFKQHKIESNNQSMCSAIVESSTLDPLLQVVEAEGDPEDDPDLVKTDYIEDEALRIPEHELAKLAKNQKLIAMLSSPALRCKMQEIDNSRMRLNMLQKALLDEEFMKFADEALITLNKTNK